MQINPGDFHFILQWLIHIIPQATDVEISWLHFISLSIDKETKRLKKTYFLDNFGHPNEWDTSQITDMSNLFLTAECLDWNYPIVQWQTQKVTNMEGMLKYCTAFNQDISTKQNGVWDVSRVTNMRRMFDDCHNFNQDIGNWNTRSVTNMSGMFVGCMAFNQDISMKEDGVC